MRTQTTKTSTSKATPRTKLSAKAKKPVKVVAVAPLASKEAARTIGETTPPKGTVPLKKLCAEIGINPKVARRELRKIRREAIAEGEKNPLVKHDLHTRWFLSGDFLKEARKVLSAYVERNGAEEE
jgi:hypothetical protein